MLPGVVLAAIGCGALWTGVITWLRTRGPRSAPQGLGPVPAAVLAALRSRDAAEDPTVLNTAVFELAEAGVLMIEPADSTHPALVYPAALPRAEALPPYQVTVVARLLHRRGGKQRPVPLTALQPGEDLTARTWYRGFVREVRKEAADRGLLRLSTRSTLYVPLLILGGVCAIVAAKAVSSYEPRTPVIALAVFANGAIIAFASLHWATRMRLTKIGRRVLAQPQEAATEALSAAELLLRPAQEALPAAAPAPHLGVKVLPGQLQPLPPHLVWSDYGGDWHPLRIRSRETYRFGTIFEGYTPLLPFAIVCLGGVVTTHTAAAHPSFPLFVFIGLPGAVLIALGASWLHRRRLPKRAVLLGQVARTWTVRRNESKGEHYFCVLDVGQAPESVRLRVGRSVYQRLRVGQLIEVTVSPRSKRIKDIRPVGGGQ